MTQKSMEQKRIRTVGRLQSNDGKLPAKELPIPANFGIDTVHLFLNNPGAEDLLRAEKLNYMGAKLWHDNVTHQRKLGNLRINLSPKQLRVEGSLSTYFHQGDNSVLVNYDNIGQVIDRLSNDLNFDAGKCYVSRLDVALTFPLPFEARGYFPLFARFGRYSSYAEENNSLYLQIPSKEKVVIVYDKSVQKRRLGHSLRFELRLTKALKAKLKFTERIMLDTLREEWVWRQLLDDISVHFKQFLIVEAGLMTVDSITSVADYYEFLDGMIDTETRSKIFGRIEDNFRDKRTKTTPAKRRALKSLARRSHSGFAIEDLHELEQAGAAALADGFKKLILGRMKPQEPVR